MIVFVIPIIQWHIRVYHNEEMREILLKTLWYDDNYHLIKTFLLYTVACVFFILFVFLKEERYIGFPRVFLLLVPYIVLVILSSYFSDYPITAFFGLIDHYEGCLTQLCYCVVLLFSYYLIRDDSHVATIIKMMLVASLVVAVIGMMRWHTVEPESGIASTIGNSNYVGTYAAILIPNAFAMMLYERGFFKKICVILFALGSSMVLLFGSMSRAAYLAALITFILFLVWMWREIIRQYKWLLVSVLYVCLLFIFMNVFSKGTLVEEWKRLNPFCVGYQDDTLYFESIRQENTSVIIKTNRWSLEIGHDGNEFAFFNTSGEEIPYKKINNDKEIQFTGQSHVGIQGFLQKNKEFEWLMLVMGEKEIELVKTDGKIKVVGYNGLITDIEQVKSYGFTGMESFASGRGYIWSRAIPLLKETMILGYGPDTFPFIFPQNDIAGKLNYGAIWVIIGKPHNWYLQIALGTGIVSLFCILSLMIWFVAKASKHLHKSCKKAGGLPVGSPDRKKVILCGILLSVIGYGVTGIFNDSVVAVSPIFWMLLGFGVRMVREENVTVASCYPIHEFFS